MKKILIIIMTLLLSLPLMGCFSYGPFKIVTDATVIVHKKTKKKSFLWVTIQKDANEQMIAALKELLKQLLKILN